MSLIIKRIKGQKYYYSFLSYRVLDKSKSFSKYIGLNKPSEIGLEKLEEAFRRELIQRLSGKIYTNLLISKDDVLRSLLFSAAFNKKYQTMTDLRRRKYDIDQTVMFTLTTLTTEEADVDLLDVENALAKESGFTMRERISKNMLHAVESIKESHKIDEKYVLQLHRMIMATFETKNPGVLRNRQVYLYRKGADIGGNKELGYRPPSHAKVAGLLSKFFGWYGGSDLNPIEKAAMAHYNLYKIHPFLDGNKRICRLLFNKTLIDNGFPLINISLKREAYFDALAASVEGNDPMPFVKFSLKQYYTQIKEFLTDK